MEARFARFIVRDSIKHNDRDHLPAAYFIEPATDEEKGRVGRGPLDDQTKQLLRDARAAKRELCETFHVSLDGADAEPAHGRATASDPASQHEGETTMSEMTKAIADGVRKIKGTKKSSKKAAPRKATKKPEAKPKPRKSTGKIGGPAMTAIHKLLSDGAPHSVEELKKITASPAPKIHRLKKAGHSINKLASGEFQMAPAS